MGIMRILLPGFSRPLVTWLAPEKRWTVKRRWRARFKSAGPAQLRLEQIMKPQEEVTTLEVPDRVECLEGQD